MPSVERHSSSPVADMLDWLESGPALGLRGFGLAPYVRIEDYMDDGTYVLRAEMPGIDPDKDVSLDIEGDVLTISGERHEEQKDKNRHELHYGASPAASRCPAASRPRRSRRRTSTASSRSGCPRWCRSKAGQGHRGAQGQRAQRGRAQGRLRRQVLRPS